VRVLVCTWEPIHTARIADAQKVAVKNGTIAAIAKEAEGDRDEIQKALAAKGLLTLRLVSGDACCAECRTPMEWLYSADHISDYAAAVRDVAENFNEAFERTRRRNSGRKDDEEE